MIRIIVNIQGRNVSQVSSRTNRRFRSAKDFTRVNPRTECVRLPASNRSRIDFAFAETKGDSSFAVHSASLLAFGFPCRMKARYSSIGRIDSRWSDLRIDRGSDRIRLGRAFTVVPFAKAICDRGERNGWRKWRSPELRREGGGRE